MVAKAATLRATTERIFVVEVVMMIMGVVVAARIKYCKKEKMRSVLVRGRWGFALDVRWEYNSHVPRIRTRKVKELQGGR